MTVGELMIALSEYDPSWKVKLYVDVVNGMEAFCGPLHEITVEHETVILEGSEKRT